MSMASRTAEIGIDLRRVHGNVNSDIYGQFVEHVGRSVYGGVFESGSRLADESGYRIDVLAATGELRPSVLRWPGGDFASGYHWRDGIGPASERPLRHELVWGTYEANAFGTEEFLELASRVGARPYLNLNCSTGTVEEALSWLEYCNSTTDGLSEVALRREGPHPNPHNVPIWGIGNENYTWRQHGHTSASSYGETAREWAKLLRWADPSIQLIGVGGPPDWNWTVLTTAGTFIDQLSLHYYWRPGAPDEDPYDAVITGPACSELGIVAAHGMCLAAQQQLGTGHKVTLAVDEWGVWYRTHPAGAGGVMPAEQMRRGISPAAGVDTKFEEDYDLKDALAVASWLHVLWRHPEKVTLATQAQMVNALGPIRTSSDGLVRETVFYPMALARQYAGPVALDLRVSCDDGVPAPGHPHGSVCAIDAGATFDEASKRLYLSLINLSRDDEIAVQLEGVDILDPTVIRLHHDDPFAGNTFDHPEEVVPSAVDAAGWLVLPPHSLTCVSGAVQ